MKGTRPLDNDEIRQVAQCFDGTFGARNRGLFMLGVSTGGRISELLNLTIGDVYQNRAAVTDLLFEKSIVKGREVSRAVPVNVDGRQAIAELIDWHREKYNSTHESRPLFPSQNKKGTVPMKRQTAHEMLKNAFTAAGLNGKLATHSLRKSFAQRVYEQSSDIYLVQCWGIGMCRRRRNIWVSIMRRRGKRLKGWHWDLNVTEGRFCHVHRKSYDRRLTPNIYVRLCFRGGHSIN